MNRESQGQEITLREGLIRISISEKYRVQYSEDKDTEDLPNSEESLLVDEDERSISRRHSNKLMTREGKNQLGRQGRREDCENHLYTPSFGWAHYGRNRL